MRVPGAASHLGFDDGPPKRMRSVFAQAVAILDATGLPYLLIGGLASAALGRPRCSADVDILVKPSDVGSILDSFGEQGLAIGSTSPAQALRSAGE